jgi:succinate dehydrogenase hydrophobic anchor subunit
MGFTYGLFIDAFKLASWSSQYLYAIFQDSFPPKLVWLCLIAKLVHVRNGSRTILWFVVYQLECLQFINHINYFSFIFLLFPFPVICLANVILSLFFCTYYVQKFAPLYICVTKL